uniref:BRCT domain-containing protein n=1 Tax=Oryza meridionalis TaxID=40149 RepID=A0A0E0DLY4_9ORYZ
MQPLENIGRSMTKEVPDDLLVISCEEDYETCSPLLKRGASVFESELILNGIVIQKLEYERFVWNYMDIPISHNSQHEFII